ncbi:MAG: hypothetical protein VXZ35_12890, partial [Pseudomonadota bacterium]|nr:hypothetical protein [Pseudomonadota bacterium]
MMGSDSAPDYAVYLQCPGTSAKGFNRNYFDNDNAYGAICLKFLNLELVEYRCGPNARGLFDQRVIQDKWSPVNGETQTYYLQNKETIQNAQGMIKDLTNLQFHKEGTIKDIKHDYAMRYLKGKLDSTKEYYDALMENGAYRLFFEALERSEDFEKITEHLDDYLQAGAKHPDLRADLDDFVKGLGPGAPLLEDAINNIEMTEHAEFIKHECEFLILKREEKCNAVMIWGAPNAGKSQHLRRLGEIFKLEYYFQTKGNFDCKYKSGRTVPSFI